MFPPNEPEPMITLGLDEPAKENPAAAPAADTLQFRKAEMAAESTGRLCSVCQQPISGDYYQINGANGCASCAQHVTTLLKRRSGWPEFGRAALFGLGGAIAGSLLYALVSYATHMSFSLLAIVVGIMVAKAVLAGSRGCRGRRFQVLAVLLTYGSITSSYIPAMITGVTKSQAKRKAASAAKSAPATPTTAPATTAPKPPLGLLGLALGLIFFLVLALIAPFLMLTSVSGLINLLIIGIGLMQAWRRTKAIDVTVVGPYPAS